jgi:hypothetical protein
LACRPGLDRRRDESGAVGRPGSKWRTEPARLGLAAGRLTPAVAGRSRSNSGPANASLARRHRRNFGRDRGRLALATRSRTLSSLAQSSSLPSPSRPWTLHDPHKARRRFRPRKPIHPASRCSESHGVRRQLRHPDILVTTRSSSSTNEGLIRARFTVRCGGLTNQPPPRFGPGQRLSSAPRSEPSRRAPR